MAKISREIHDRLKIRGNDPVRPILYYKITTKNMIVMAQKRVHKSPANLKSLEMIYNDIKNFCTAMTVTLSKASDKQIAFN
ncbi:9200_t:CDS:2 [Funneliformis geosporum]|nr:9200_t:CDS:2 [Funneliformis geosporum]